MNSPRSVLSGGGSVVDTAVNIAKVCIGTGVLALPSAMEGAGVGVGVATLFVVGLWNVHASRRLVQLQAASGCASYAALAHAVFGRVGRALVDLCTISTLLGATTVYVLTGATLLHHTPLALAADGAADSVSAQGCGSSSDEGGGGGGSGGHPASESVWKEVVLCVALSAPLCVWRELQVLAKTSALGLVALLAGIVAIVAFGMAEYGTDGLSSRLPSPPAATATVADLDPTVGGDAAAAAVCSDGSPVAIPVLPQALEQLSRFFGIAAFCYGVPPLQFSIQSSMARPTAFVRALSAALAFVFVVYVGGSVWIIVLYRCDPMGLQENVLSNLPLGSAAAVIVRLCYAVVCVTSVPLLVAPLGDMLVDLCCAPKAKAAAKITASPVVSQLRSGDASTTEGAAGGGSSWGCCRRRRRRRCSTSNVVSWRLMGVRAAVLCCCACVAIFVPFFGLIVAIVGSFSVSLLSFVIPSAMVLACAVTTSWLPGRRSDSPEPLSSGRSKSSPYISLDSIDGADGDGDPEAAAAATVSRPAAVRAGFAMGWAVMAAEAMLLLCGVATCLLTTALTVSSAATGA
jgi:amino acid permease